MVGEITKVKIPSNRTIGSVAFALLAAQCGVAFLRVHDILETKQALLVLESIGLIRIISEEKYFGTDGIRGTVGSFP